jgi:non-heme chloroperoxidase
MSTITTKDGTEIYYKDWGEGPVVTFSHGWPLNADAWESQMLFLAQNGFRCIAHDRRGHGRSSQPSGGNDMGTYADDLEQLFDKLGLDSITMVGHSTGGGEVTHYIGRHGTKRVVGAVLISAIPPGLVKNGVPVEEFDALRASLLKDRGEFYRQFGVLFYGLNRPNANVPQSTTDLFWTQCMQVGLKNSFECLKAISETDFTEDLKKFDFPTLFLHGEDDQVVPLNVSSKKAARLVKDATEIYYPGAPHGITTTHQDEVNNELLGFVRAVADKTRQGGRTMAGAAR